MQQQRVVVILTAVAVLFHIIGLAGIGWLHAPQIIAATPVHLLLMFLLLLVSFLPQKRKAFTWLIVAWLAGFVAEWTGVHTGILFGQYHYTSVLGTAVQGIPLLIGCNWAVVVAGAVSLSARVTKNIWVNSMLAALLTVVYDFIMEPVAMQLHYWQWQGGIIPVWNYICWALLSFLLAWFWKKMNLSADKFAANLFIIQLLFFIVLRLIA